MKNIILFLGIIIVMLSGCESDVEKIKIRVGVIPVPVLTQNLNNQTAYKLLKTNADSILYKLDWTQPQYLNADTTSGIVGNYAIYFSKTSDFKIVKVVYPSKYMTQSFKSSEINQILLDLGATPEVESEIFIKVQSAFFKIDTLFSNTVKATFITYNTLPPPAVALPVGDIYLFGSAIGPWVAVFPDTWKFTKLSDTSYTITYNNLIPGKDYEVVLNNNWDQDYHLPAGIVRSNAIYSGTFMEDGNKAHDALGGIVSRWVGQQFLAPPVAGTYTITLDFQTGTFTVVKQ